MLEEMEMPAARAAARKSQLEASPRRRRPPPPPPPLARLTVVSAETLCERTVVKPADSTVVVLTAVRSTDESGVAATAARAVRSCSVTPPELESTAGRDRPGRGSDSATVCASSGLRETGAENGKGGRGGGAEGDRLVGSGGGASVS